MDYPICYAQARNRTTNAHQHAMAAVYYSPLSFLYWCDDVAKYRDAPAAPEVLGACPTVWDETRGMSGEIGEYVVVARRSGKCWFVGAMTNEQERDLPLPLPFLGAGTWRVRRFCDGESPGGTANLTAVELRDGVVRAGDTLTLRLAASGGQALIFTP